VRCVREPRVCYYAATPAVAKLREKAIDAADIKQYLTSRDDFDLELYVFRIARELHFEASHGGSYQDPVTGKARQYDVRARLVRETEQIALAIECKALKPSSR